MVFFGTSFWPLFWTVFGAGAAVTVIASLLVAMIPAARRDHQRSAPVALPRRHVTSTHSHAA